MLNSNIPQRCKALQLPVADRYIDQAQIWLGDPLPVDAIQHLLQVNANPDPRRGTIHVHNKPMWYHPAFRQRLQIMQMQRATLEELRKIIGDGVSLVNQVELASDHGYSGEWNMDDRDHAFEILSMGWIRMYHRRKHGVRFVRDEAGSVT